jgi:hypothetical protein
MLNLKRIVSIGALVAVFYTVLGCGTAAQAAPNVGAVAQTISIDAGIVGAKGTTGKGSTVIVFEEDHGSISGQIEQALMLTRLRDKFGLRDIVLEGYSGGGLEASARKVREAMGKRSSSSVERIAATLVREGELSAAEFMAIAYPDVRIVKGESAGGATSEEREQTFDFYMNSRPLLALIAIEHHALTGLEAERFLTTLKSLMPIDSQVKAESLIKLCEPVIQKDAWTRERNETLFSNGKSIVAIEDQIAATREVRTEAKKLPPNIATLATSADGFESFLEARRQASAQLVKSSVDLAAKGSSPVIALIIGAAHTAAVATMLADAKVPYAVIRPDSLGSTQDVRLPGRAYDRKLRGLSTTGVLAGALEGAFPDSTRHKPAPVLDQNWLSAKAELYGMVDDLTERLAKGGPAPAGAAEGGGTKPPSIDTLLVGMPDDSFRGSFIFIDRKRIKEQVENGRHVYIFPVVMNPGDSSRSKTVWVKTAFARDTSPAKGQTSKAEQALREAYDELQKETSGGKDGVGKDPGKGKDGDGNGKEVAEPMSVRLADVDGTQIKVSRNVSMLIGDSEEQVTRGRLSL